MTFPCWSTSIYHQCLGNIIKNNNNNKNLKRYFDAAIKHNISWNKNINLKLGILQQAPHVVTLLDVGLSKKILFKIFENFIILIS